MEQKTRFQNGPKVGRKWAESGALVVLLVLVMYLAKMVALIAAISTKDVLPLLLVSNH